MKKLQPAALCLRYDPPRDPITLEVFWEEDYTKKYPIYFFVGA